MTDHDRLIWILGSAVVSVILGLLIGYWSHKKDLKKKALPREEQVTIDPFDIAFNKTKLPAYFWGAPFIFFGLYLVYYGFKMFG